MFGGFCRNLVLQRPDVNDEAMRTKTPSNAQSKGDKPDCDATRRQNKRHNYFLEQNKWISISN